MNPSEILSRVKALCDDCVEIRRAIHRHPEMGRHEIQTSRLVRETLSAMPGMEVRSIADTGVLGILKGSKGNGRCIAFRADMDALPIHENTGLPYASEQDGVMHACGHDMHTAALLGTAKILSRYRDTFAGEVRFFFQPDEEGDGGAQRMCNEGCMQGVDAVFGAHVASGLPVGKVGLRYGNAYAASNPFDITITGKSAHGAQPQNGTDAIVAASEIVLALQTLVSRVIAPTDSAVISIGSFHAGTARNIIADEVRLAGMLRCYGDAMRRTLSERMTQLVNGIAAAHGCGAEIHIQWGYAGVVNQDDMTNLVRKNAELLLGTDAVILEDTPSLTTEDFGAFMQYAPGCFWHAGVANADGICAPLHNPQFAPDENALFTMITLNTALAQDFLKADF